MVEDVDWLADLFSVRLELTGIVWDYGPCCVQEKKVNLTVYSLFRSVFFQKYIKQD